MYKKYSFMIIIKPMDFILGIFGICLKNQKYQGNSKEYQIKKLKNWLRGCAWKKWFFGTLPTNLGSPRSKNDTVNG